MNFECSGSVFKYQTLAVYLPKVQLVKKVKKATEALYMDKLKTKMKRLLVMTHHLFMNLETQDAAMAHFMMARHKG